MNRVLLTGMMAVGMMAAGLYGQEARFASLMSTGDSDAAPEPIILATPAPQPPGGNRIFGLLPNYSTANASDESTVLSSRRKLSIAARDSFDSPVFATSAGFAGYSQLFRSQTSFGGGVKGFSHRLATNFADQAIGNMLTEGMFPVLLHEDPRYFRRGKGSAVSRVGYALSRVMVTHTDSGGTRFNYSEWLGNASAVGISNAYYPGGSLSGDATKLLVQVASDAGSQVLKEFWPDIRHKLFPKATD
jgi:hypothetical protein